MTCLASQVAKVILRVIRKLMNGKLEERIAKNQYGFRKRKGTRSAFFILRMLIEKCLEMLKNTSWSSYVDFSKTFDRVNPEDMMEILEEIVIDRK